MSYGGQYGGGGGAGAQYARPQDPYIHSNASQYDDRYQQDTYSDNASYGPPVGAGAGGAGAGAGAGGAAGGAYRDYNDGYGSAAGNAAAAAQTYSYPPPKKGVSRWIKYGIPLALLVIAATVIGGVLGHRAAEKNDKTKSAAASASGAVASAAKANGGFGLAYVGTDEYANPIYTSATVSGQYGPPTAKPSAPVTCSPDPWSSASGNVNNIRPDHPVLFAPKYQWDCLANKIAKDPYLTLWNETIYANASYFYGLPPTNYSIDGGFNGSGILDVSREVQLRIKHWGYMWRMTQDTKWADRAWTEITVAAGNTTQPFGQAPAFPANNHWNPDHFLDVAEMTLAFAYAYDWFYDYWPQDRREAIMWSIINLGLQPGLQQYSSPGNGWWAFAPNNDGNWNCVCNGGLLLGALAIKNDDPTGIAEQILQKAIPNALQGCVTGVQPDGTWTETPNYWYFGNNMFAQMSLGLITATGSDQGLLSANPDFWKSGLFHMYVSGMTGMFQYADCGPNKYTATANSLMFYASQFNKPEYTLFQRDRADAPEPLAMFYYNTTHTGGFFNGLALDNYFDYVQDMWVSMRSSWTDWNGVYVAMKSGNLTGHQTHGDLDAGDFVLDALGVRWAGELGSGNYLSTGYFSSEAPNSQRWLYYRKRTEGQNTLLFNKQNQNPNFAPTSQFKSSNVAQNDDINFKPGPADNAYFITDLTRAVNSSWSRGVRMLNSRRQVLVQDETDGSAPVTQWRMHTNATINLSSDKKTAHLSLDGKNLDVVIQSPSSATFGIEDPDQAPASEASLVPWQQPGEVANQDNTPSRVLTIDLAAGPNTVVVLFNPQWNDKGPALVTPPVVPFSGWSMTSHDVSG